MRKEIIRIRLTKEEKDAFQKKAKESKCSISEYIRKEVLSKQESQKDIEAEEIRKTDVRKQNVVAFRISNKEYLKLSKTATEAGISISSYIRKKVFDGEVIIISGLREYAMQLRKIGTNINQLTSLANSGLIYSPDLSGIRENIEEMWNELKRFTDKH